ncbi:MAG: glycosyltransferase family 39 protein [Acidobacteria bacterium]|nr:glycosyltransferase family 39 protein [Acidobacteriota bacterium]
MTMRAWTHDWTTAGRRASLERGIEGAAGLALAVALVAALTGSGIRFGPWTLPVREVWRPCLLAGVLVGWRALMLRRAGEGGGAAPGESSASDAAFSVVCSCGIATGVLLWANHQIRFCGGSDSYGYVSAAHALVKGQLILPQPIVQWLPFPGALPVATPLGWAPAPSGNAIVPGYPLGLSIAMAIFILVAGPGAEFYVPFAAGIGLLFVTYRLTARLTDWRIAAVATLLVAFNPVVMNMVTQPMSDVPAAFCYLLAVYVLLVEPRHLPAAGLAAGLCIWTRPIMVVTLPALLWLLPRTRDAWLRFAAGLAPVAALIAGAQWHLYGGPLKTGYGAPPGLFRVSMVALNAPTYARWITIVHSPLVFLAVALGVWRAPRRLVMASALGFVLGILPFLFTGPYFDDFGLIRYILPVLIPCLLVAVIGVGDMMTRYLSRSAAVAALSVFAIAAASYSYRVVASEGMFHGVTQESRYAAVGDWIRDHTPLQSVVLAEIHSGSLRFYADRTTIRFALLPQDELAATVRALAGRGIACFAAIDGEEEERLFRQRFSREFANVTMDPIGGVRGTIFYRLETKG